MRIEKTYISYDEVSFPTRDECRYHEGKTDLKDWVGKSNYENKEELVTFLEKYARVLWPALKQIADNESLEHEGEGVPF